MTHESCAKLKLLATPSDRSAARRVEITKEFPNADPRFSAHYMKNAQQTSKRSMWLLRVR